MTTRRAQSPRISLLCLFALGASLGTLTISPGVAGAEDTFDRARTALKTLAKQNQIKHYTKTINGTERIHVNPSTYQGMQAMNQHFGRGSNVLQILHSASSTSSHSLAIFDGELIHLQYRTGSNKWRLRSWGSQLSAGRSKMYGALIQLEQNEADNLRGRIRLARQEQGTDESRWEIDGHIKTAFGNRSFNCTSGWCGMPIGGKGEPLYKLIGLPYETGIPKGFQQQLELGGNKRILGLAVYGPDVTDFGRNPKQADVRFE